jgi:hypothetical protein
MVAPDGACRTIIQLYPNLYLRAALRLVLWCAFRVCVLLCRSPLLLLTPLKLQLMTKTMTSLTAAAAHSSAAADSS